MGTVRKGAADNDDDKRTRFPCLAVVRYVAAGVVSVLVVFFVAMVVTVDLRGPDDFRFSIVQGHVEASALWSKKERTIPRPPPRSDSDDDEGLRVRGQHRVVDTYEAASSTTLWVTMSAYNPSGRFDIHCYNISYRVLDMPHGPDSFDGMVEIAGASILPRHGLQVRPQSSHTIRRWVRVDDASVLAYIARAYAGRTSFPAMVQVNATIVYVTQTVRRKSDPKSVIHWCWPVTVGLDEPRTATDAVTCTPREKVVYPVDDSTRLSPAPAPAVSAL